MNDDLDTLLPGLTMLVHPAFMEGLGVALLEAAACGVPIVATRAGGIPEIVRDGENGVLVEPGDRTALARAISSLLADPDRARRLGRSGRRIVEADFSLARMASATRAVYRDVLGQVRSP